MSATPHTAASDERFVVRDLVDESRYVLIDTQAGDGAGEREAGEETYVDVTTGAGRTERVLFHTGVHDAYAGQGLASVLVRHVVDDVVARGFAIVPVCPYVKGWLPQHPGYEAHVVPATPTHLRAIAER